MDLRVFRSLNFSLSIAQMGVLSMAFFGAITVLPLYLSQAVGATALESGLLLLPGSLAMGFAGPIVGRIYDTSGTRVLLVPGAVLAVAALWAYATYGADTSIWVILVTQIVLSLGLALSFTPLFTASLASLQPRFYSYGSAVLGTVQQVAGAAGVAVMVTTMSAIAASAVEAGLPANEAAAAGARGAFLVSAIVALPILVGAFIIRKPADQPEGAIPAH